MNWNKNVLEPKAPKDKPKDLMDLLKDICDKLDALIVLNTPADNEDS